MVKFGSTFLLFLLAAVPTEANRRYPWGLISSFDTATRQIAKTPFGQIHDFHTLFTIRGGDTDDDSEYDYDDEDSETEDEYDEEDEYDSDEDTSHSDEEEESSTVLAKNIKSKAKSKPIENDEDHDAPLSLSPFQDMGVTLGVMLLCSRLDLTNSKIIKIARFAFVAYVVLAQLFLLYVRYKAKSINNTTPITIENPISNLLQSQLSNGPEDGGGGSSMVKNIANSMLSSSSTIVDYDLQQAKMMNGGLLFPMAMLWFLHFKMGQVQPLFYQTANGFKELVFSPLFQIYILGRNLERPFKNKKAEEMQKMMDSSRKDEDGDNEEVDKNDTSVTEEDSEVEDDSNSDEYDTDETDISDSDSDSEDTDSDEEEYDDSDDE